MVQHHGCMQTSCTVMSVQSIILCSSVTWAPQQISVGSVVGRYIHHARLLCHMNHPGCVSCPFRSASDPVAKPCQWPHAHSPVTSGCTHKPFPHQIR